jgi:lysophospholipase L1-like esterase
MLVAVWCVTLGATLMGAELAFLPGVHRVVFLGDSITYSGEYIEYLDTYAFTRFPARRLELLNLGLPSETVSGLSEPAHAGGQFPRPDLHERLGRVLAQTKPDLVVACYGMNDGIYHPFAADRFERFRIGVQRLRERVAAAGAKVLHLTPPTFDPLPLRGKTLPAGLSEYRSPYEGYNEVLDRYAAWLLGQRAQGWDVADAHGPMNRHLAERRRREPDYRLAADGVHVEATGHWILARELLLHWGAPASVAQLSGGNGVLASHPQGAELARLVQRRQRLLKDAWLTAVGHQRPGLTKGLPLPEAQAHAAELEAKIRALVGAAPESK